MSRTGTKDEHLDEGGGGEEEKREEQTNLFACPFLSMFIPISHQSLRLDYLPMTKDFAALPTMMSTKEERECCVAIVTNHCLLIRHPKHTLSFWTLSSSTSNSIDQVVHGYV